MEITIKKSCGYNTDTFSLIAKNLTFFELWEIYSYIRKLEETNGNR